MLHPCVTEESKDLSITKTKKYWSKDVYGRFSRPSGQTR